MTLTIGRRELLALLGGATAWPVAARAQQPAMPMIGFMSARSPDDSVHLLEAFRRGPIQDNESVLRSRPDHSRPQSFSFIIFRLSTGATPRVPWAIARP
jgi:hypothetical protein